MIIAAAATSSRMDNVLPYLSLGEPFPSWAGRGQYSVVRKGYLLLILTPTETLYKPVILQ